MCKFAHNISMQIQTVSYMKGKYLDPKADLTYRERVFYDDGYKKGQVAGREEGREEGRAEGLAEGIEKNKRDNARQMKADGMPAELIAKYTGLSIEIINCL